MTQQHTPGPFDYWPDDGSRFHIGRLEADGGCAQHVGKADREADASLFAAAPELLAAGEALEQWAEQLGGWEAPVWQTLRAAILKARGRA